MPPAASDLLARLAARVPVDAPVALVVAHPDDETIGAGAVLPLFRQLLLIHVTDGAPRNGADATAHGFATVAAYAAARQAELTAALAVAGVAPPRVCLDISDQGASAALPTVTARLAELLAGMAAVLTHPYEGGHPDHDATALAVHRAARCPVWEFAGYHAAPDGMATGCFLPTQSEGTPPIVLPLPLAGEGRGEGGTRATAVTPDPWPHPYPSLSRQREREVPTILHLTTAEAARKRAMLDCFATQRATLAPFGTVTEVFRPAPRYDFTRPPHPGPLHYERYDWGMTGERWRALAC